MEQEKQRQVEREEERQDGEKSGHEQEPQQLIPELENSNGVSNSNPSAEECQALQDQDSVLQEELTTQQQQKEEKLDKNLDSIAFKKSPLQDLERQEHINAVVDQEVKQHLFEEKVEQEKQRQIEREEERQDGEKSGHEREPQQLIPEFENSNGVSSSHPFAGESQELQDQDSVLQDELTAQLQQQKEEYDKNLDSTESKNSPLQDLERQQHINNGVDQEVKQHLHEEKVEQEKQQQDGEEKSGHEQELQQLISKLKNSNGVSSSKRYAKVKRLSSEKPTPIVEISIPSYAVHSKGRNSHYKYEVKIRIGDEVWSVLRRYSQFRQLHWTMMTKYPDVDVLSFPPRKLFNKTERVAAERRVMLEQYLQNLVEMCQCYEDSPLHPENNEFLNKHIMGDFDPFFRRGLFERP